jgi:arachidonate 15-lipoxygenase
MAYAPNHPLALMTPALSGPRLTESDYLRMLPTHESAHIQLFILKLLGSLYHSRLGHYRKGPAGMSYFGPGAIGNLEAAFVTKLDDVERTIQERNQSRRAYRYLLPSEIPQSINI